MKKNRAGLTFGSGIVGKHLYRVRETHVRDHYAPLMARNAVGTVKLDIVLRGIALSPQHLGERSHSGLVLPKHSWEQLHDLARPADTFGLDTEDPKVRDKKREWVREQLVKLEDLQLMRRVDRARGRRRPLLYVLRDDGSGEPYDDPDGRGANSYVTLTGAVVAAGKLQTWRAPEVAFFLAAMVAERFETQRRRQAWGKNYEAPPIGSGEWFQPLHWFSDPKGYRPSHHVTIPFSEQTLQRGLRRLRKDGLIEVTRITTNPITKKRFESPARNLYTNGFSTLVSDHQIVELIESAEDVEVAGRPLTTDQE